MPGGQLARLVAKKYSDYWLVSGLRLFLLLDWDRRFANTLNESALNVRIFDGVPRGIPGVLSFDKPAQLVGLKFDYVLLRPDDHGYIERGHEDRSLSPNELADHVLRIYMDAAERHHQG